MSLSADFEGKTLDDVLERMGAASYKQIGPWFENSGIKDVFDPVVSTAKVYFDNIRFVPLTTQTFSDFPE
jgi:DNA phosphorothioation-dependent restriction protein DptG